MPMLRSSKFQLKFLPVAIFFCVFSFAASKDPFAIRISCGAREDVHTKPTNALWYRDFGYTGGRIANVTRTSFIVPPLKTLRYFPLSDGSENCYNIDNIPNGHFSVRVFFALIKDGNENEPVFDISIKGTQIYSLKPGWTNSDDQSFVESLVFITDRSMSICFHSTGHGDPSIVSIEILQVDANAYNFGPPWNKGTVLRTVKRISCGNSKSAFDEDLNGNHWGGDRFWSGVSTFDQGSDKSISTANKILKTSIAPEFYPEKLYRSAIVSTDRQPDITFKMEVDSNRNYSIWLHFAEIDSRISRKGERVFDVLLNGDVAHKDVDVIQMSGQSNAALVLIKTIFVSGRSLTINLRPSRGSLVIINAIEVFDIISAEYRTSPEEVRALQVLKKSMGLPQRLGWNGDPCVPRQHPWSGIDCQFDKVGHRWNIDGLGLDNQGLMGVLPKDISKLRHLLSINVSGNSLQGLIPDSLGTISGLEVLDLSYNEFNGSIPEGLGLLKSLKVLNLNGNYLSGKVPSKLGGLPLHGASFNFTENDGLCGIPGLPSCGPHLSVGAKIGIGFGALISFLLILLCFACWWKRRQNILRSQKIAASREAPYAKSRTNFVRDVQMTKPQRIHDQSKNPIESGS